MLYVYLGDRWGGFKGQGIYTIYTECLGTVINVEVKDTYLDHPFRVANRLPYITPTLLDWTSRQDTQTGALDEQRASHTFVMRCLQMYSKVGVQRWGPVPPGR